MFLNDFGKIPFEKFNRPPKKCIRIELLKKEAGLDGDDFVRNVISIRKKYKLYILR